MKQAAKKGANIKRIIDVIGALTGILLCAPLAVAVGLAIWCCMGAPILFRQPRSGIGGRRFSILKFRTMSDARGCDGRLLPDEERVTFVGRFMRNASLDELPQFINVLRGEMSLVGPRPLLPEYDARYSPRQARRMDVLPGITGWAQVHGRNRLDWTERLERDAWYVENASVWLDLRILAMTAKQVLRFSETSDKGCVTMPEFLGSQQ